MTLCSQREWELAKTFLFDKASLHALLIGIEPHWIPGRNEFWFQRKNTQSKLVNVETSVVQDLFDEQVLAERVAANGFSHDLASAGAAHVEAFDGVVARIRIRDDEFLYRIEDGQLLRQQGKIPGEVLSPDGRLAAFVRDHNIWLRDTDTSAIHRLTDNGIEHFAWAKSPDMNLATVSHRRRDIVLPAVLLWSPDSTRIFTHRLDERRVLELPLVQNVPQDGSVRPKLYSMRFAFSGDTELPLAHHSVIDVRSGFITDCECDPAVVGLMSIIEAKQAWWSTDGRRVYYLSSDRRSSKLDLYEVDAATGLARVVISETSDTFLETNISYTGRPSMVLLHGSQEAIWFSQRDGWGHLYLYNLSDGSMKRRITSGNWLVTDIIGVDEGNRTVIFQAAGRDASNLHYRQICSQSLDRDEFRQISSEQGDSAAPFLRMYLPREFDGSEGENSALSPDCRYLVYHNAARDRAPCSIIYDLRRDVARVLEPGSMSHGIPVPQPIEAIAADGKTTLFGTMWLPSSFDPTKVYPSLNYIYPGPQRRQSPRNLCPYEPGEFFVAMVGQAFAELGIVVYCIDARGTPGRSKSFHDECYERLADPTNLDDQVAVLKQLHMRHTFIDRAKTGIMGHSSGGNAAVRAMLLHPDVFGVGVATAGNHDQRGYAFNWTEKYNGPFEHRDNGSTNYDQTANSLLVDRLQGRLMLATGDMDDNVHLCLTMQLVSALIDAGKDFEMLIIPNGDHATIWKSEYFLRRAIGFLTENLCSHQKETSNG